LSNGRDAALQGSFGDGTLLFGQIGEHRIAMGASGLEPLRLGPLRKFRRSSEVRSGPAPRAWSAIGAWMTTGAIASWPIGTCRPWSTSGFALASRRTFRIAAWPPVAFAAVASRRTITSRAGAATIAAVVSIALGQLLSDCLERPIALDQVEHPRLGGLLSRGRHRQDGVALELDFGVGLQHRTHLGVGWQQ
jgi:hypothetical protein